MDGQNPVLIIAETAGGVLRPVSLELVTAGRKIADLLDVPLVALVSGAEVSEAARELGTAGPNRVLVTEDPELADYTAERMTAVVAKAVEEIRPAIILIPGTTAGRDYAPRLAARLQTGLAADAVDLNVENGELIAIRPVLGGRVQTAVKLSGQPQMATIRPGVFEKAELGSGTATSEPVAVSLTPDDLRIFVRETVQEAASAAKLEEADIIV
ncbi:MAG TPA: hypothetical protein VFL82_07030, partial [Thermomicrobiales bacterium]|nr:hypothetical protein [Thermomicrobiales bacterium]